MIEALVGVLTFVLRVVDFVLEMVVFIPRMKGLGGWATGSDRIVEVPADPKILPPAAQRALAEAEARRDRAAFIDKYVSPSCNR